MDRPRSEAQAHEKIPQACSGRGDDERQPPNRRGAELARESVRPRSQIERLIVGEVEHPAIDTGGSSSHEPQILMRRVANIAIGFEPWLAADVKIETAPYQPEESEILGIHARAPDRCRANDTPGDASAILCPTQLLGYDFASAIRGVGSEILVVDGCVADPAYQLRG